METARHWAVGMATRGRAGSSIIFHRSRCTFSATQSFLPVSQTRLTFYFRKKLADESPRWYQLRQRGSRELSETFAPIRGRSALRRLHVCRSRGLAIYHAPEHFFSSRIRAQSLFPGTSQHRYFL